MEIQTYKVGDTLISLDKNSKAIFYRIINEFLDSSNCTWYQLEGIQVEHKIQYPKLYLDKVYKVVPKSTVNILFGGENGKETKST